MVFTYKIGFKFELVPEKDWSKDAPHPSQKVFTFTRYTVLEVVTFWDNGGKGGKTWFFTIQLTDFLTQGYACVGFEPMWCEMLSIESTLAFKQSAATMPP